MHPIRPGGDGPYPPFREQRPKTAIPTSIGVLNITFGSVLLLCGICTGLNMAMQSAMMPMFGQQQQQFQQIMEAERAKQLKDLKKLEEAAPNAEEKATFEGQRKALEAQPIPKMPDMAKFYEEVNIPAYGIADAVSGLILNILMVIAGIGLLGFKEWARQLGLWVAALKMVRLVALYGFFAIVMAPNISKAFTSMFQEMAEGMAKGAPPGQKVPAPAEFAQMGMAMGVMMTAFAIGMIIFGAIYPIIVLILLSRPRVKAACTSAALSNGDN
jgi:hypothetical protein